MLLDCEGKKIFHWYIVESISIRENFGEKASLVTQMVKNPPTVQETWVLSLGQEDPLGKEMATHSSILS